MGSHAATVAIPNSEQFYLASVSIVEKDIIRSDICENTPHGMMLARG